MSQPEDFDDLLSRGDWLLAQAKAKTAKKDVGDESLLQWLQRVTPLYTWTWPYMAYLVDHLQRLYNGEFDREAVQLPPRHGKLLAHETPVWTSSGWKTHGDLRPGDHVLGSDGEFTEVVGITGELLTDCRMIWSDGTEMFAHSNHEWAVEFRGEEKTFETRQFIPRLGTTLSKVYLPKIKGVHGRRRTYLSMVEKQIGPPGRCIQVRNEDGIYLVGKNLLPTHNSSLHSIRFPVYCLEKKRQYRVCVGAYNQVFAEKFSRQARTLAKRCGLTMSRERSASMEWETTDGGVFRACGVGSPPIGEGFDLLIVDDPIRSRKEADSLAYRDKVWDWFVEDLTTRLEPGAKVIIPMTRFHVDDLIGRLQNHDDRSAWKFIRLPAEAEEDDVLGRLPGQALCPARYDESALKRRRREMTSLGYASLFQQRPTPKEGMHFKRDWFKDYIIEGDKYYLTDRTMILDTDLTKVMIVDPAGGKKGSDNTGILIVAYAPRNRILLLDAISKRIPIEDLYTTVERLASQWGVEWMGVEANGFQIEVVRTIRDKTSIPVRELMPGSKEKLVRAQRAIVMAEQGDIFVPPHAEWLDRYFFELTSFTGQGDEEDALVDCTAYAALEYERFEGGSQAPVTWGGLGQRGSGDWWRYQ